MFQENVGYKFDVCSIFKTNALLENVVEDIRKLGKELTKQDYIVIVGGAENSLDISQGY
jgi:predicted Rossmann-fold nucleotide-binding protein